MQRLIAAAGALALLASGPATAQTFMPTVAAYRYCDLRRMGVGQVDSLNAAFKQARSPEQRITVMRNGKPMDVNLLIFAKTVSELCNYEWLSEPIPNP